MNNTFLRKTYVKSLTPYELLKLHKQQGAVCDNFPNERYLEYWKNKISKEGNNDEFKDYCQANNLKESDICLMLSTLNLDLKKIKLPLWVETLRKVLCKEKLAHHHITSENNDKPFYEIICPFINYFSREFKNNLTKFSIEINYKLINDLLEDFLYKDLYNISSSVFFKEFDDFRQKKNVKNTDIYRSFIKEILSNEYQDIFNKYPMLARKISYKTQRYLEFITTMFERYNNDVSEIENEFGIRLNEICGIHLNMGDQHNGGSTLIIDFQNSNKIIYKPTNISITKPYNLFLNWMSNKLGDELRTFNIVDKKKYGWIEFVEYKECSSIEDVKLYFERAGILTGIAYFLNSTDCHFENVIANGNCPVLIDHETITSPQIKGKNNFVQQKTRTVLGTLLIPVNQDRVPSYICGFGSSKELEISIMIPDVKNCNTGNMVVIPKTITKKLYKKNKPILNEKEQNLINYQAEFKKGFKKSYDLVLRNKNELLRKDSPINCLKNLKIRFLNRHTGIYFKILKMLNKPDYLSDSIKYGLKLEILARAYVANRNYSDFLKSEREQMLLGDIPVFYMNTSSKKITLYNENINIFHSSAYGNIRDKIEKSSIEDLKYQMTLINEVITL